jgi:hypothetical protein
MTFQAQISRNYFATIAALEASPMLATEVAYVLATNAFYRKVGGIAVKVNDANLTTINQAIADLQTLSGMAANSGDLNTFTGTTIPDDATIKGALQALETQVELMIPLSQKGAASGVAPLGADSKIAATYLPSYVDDVIESTTYAGLPTTGETGKIYVVTSGTEENRQYRWTGTVYAWINQPSGSAVTSVFTRTGAIVAAAGDYTAAQVTNTPAGNIAATTVQAALDELDTEKQVKVQIKEEGTNVGTAGGFSSINFIGGGVTAAANGTTPSQLDITVTKGFTQQFKKLTPTAVNTVADLTPVPLDPALVIFTVSGITETNGISTNAAGNVNIAAATLGYDVTTEMVVTASYFSA